jgi:polar amino acid transport system substrate-binding protein
MPVLPTPAARLSTLMAISMAIALPATSAKGATPADCPQATSVGISDLGYASYQENGSVRGTSVDVIAELGRRTGCRFDISWFPRGRMFVEFEEGKIDMVLTAARSPERDASGNFVAYTHTQFDLVLRKPVDGTYASLADFVDRSHARLDITRGIVYPPPVQAQLERLQRADRLDYVSDFNLAFRKLAAGRSDGTLAPPVIYLQHLDQLGLRDSVTTTPLPESRRQDAGAYLSKRTMAPALQSRFAATLRAIAADGTLQKIYARYVDEATVKRLFKNTGP